MDDKLEIFTKKIKNFSILDASELRKGTVGRSVATLHGKRAMCP
jgi:hypothetical protein